MIDEVKLKELTIEYWEQNWQANKYITDLLPKELDYLKQLEKLDQRRRISTDSAEILVQLVGFSWEPLLISVCAYKPQKIVLILNKWYNKQEGKNRGQEFKEYIKKLREQGLINNEPVILPDPWETVENTPETVFKFLKKHTLSDINADKRVVIDITGSKKSMVSGAYLFSSYTHCPVSYVDDDEFDEKYHRPYGYKCRIEELKDPMKLFRLREWNRVEQLYEQYAFEGAKKLINDIKENTKSLLEEREHEGIALIIECLEFYGTWDDGDYRRAEEKYQKLGINGIACPTAVENLGGIWPDKNNLKKDFASLEGLENINSSIYLKDAELLVYAQDELEKIKRLIKYNEDFRSALLRAAGLNEFLFRARIIQLWIKNQLIVEINGKELSRENINKSYSKYLSEFDKELLKKSASYRYIKALRWTENKKDRDEYSIELYLKDFESPIIAHRSNSAKLLNNFWKPLEKTEKFSLFDVFELRHKAIHFCLSVTKEIAETAVKFAEENLKDFKENWTENAIIDGKYEAMNWHALCDACGIKFIPKLRE